MNRGRHYKLDNGNIRIEFGQQLSFLELDRMSCLQWIDLLIEHLNDTKPAQEPAKVVKLRVVDNTPDGDTEPESEG